MAHKTYKVMTFKMDNVSGTIAALTGSVNQASLASALSIIEDSAFGDSQRTYLPGLAGATISINGFSNSTTDAILGPLMNRTSITKTVELYNGDKYYNGEVFVTDVTYSGSVNDLATWSFSGTFDGAVTRTAVAL